MYDVVILGDSTRYPIAYEAITRYVLDLLQLQVYHTNTTSLHQISPLHLGCTLGVLVVYTLYVVVSLGVLEYYILQVLHVDAIGVTPPYYRYTTPSLECI